MRVLEINSVCGIKSTGRICTDIADVLTAAGHSCKIGFGRENVPSKYNDYAIRIGSPFDCYVHAIGSRLFDNTGKYSRVATKRFLDWVDDFQPDIIHLHNLHGYYINIQLLFAYIKEHHIPIVWTLHDCWSFTGHCAYFSSVNCDKWRNGCGDCCQKKTYPSSLLFDRSKTNLMEKARMFSGVEQMTFVTPSVWLAEIARNTFLNAYPIKVIPNGIDLSVFRPTKSNFREEHDFADKKIILGVASVWDERKGLPDFLELRSLLDDTYQIVLVGLDEKQRSLLPDGILALERTNSTRELAEIYSTTDLFFNPSKEETMGLTTIEAVACGTPAIVYDTTALPETISPSSGIILPLNDVSKVAEAVRWICTFHSFKAENCVAHAAQYSKAAMTDKYLALYSEVMK